MKSKVIGIFLVLYLLAGLAFAGLSESAPITLRMRTLQHGEGAVVEKGIIEDFNKSQDKIKVDMIQGLWTEGYSQLRLAVMADNAPHLFLSHILKVVEMYEYYTPWEASPVGNLLEMGKIDTRNFQENALKMGNHKGHQYILPLDYHGEMIFYNKDIFRKVGLNTEPENFPDNMGAFTAACNKIRDAGHYAFHQAADGPARYYLRSWYNFYWQQGGELFDPNYTKATFNNEKGLKALQFVVDIIHKHKWNVAGSDGYKQFASGNLGILCAGNWALGEVVKSGVNWGAYKIPNLFGKRYTWANSQGFVIPKQPAGTSKDVYMAGVEVMKWYLQNSHKWTMGSGMISAWNPALKNPELVASDAWKKAGKWIALMGEEGALHFPVVHPKGSELEDSMMAEVELAAYGKQSPQDALSKAEKVCNKILSQ